jgi:hypothetical protein
LIAAETAIAANLASFGAIGLFSENKVLKTVKYSAASCAIYFGYISLNGLFLIDRCNVHHWFERLKIKLRTIIVVLNIS